MSRIQRILQRARDPLSDKIPSRHDQPRLLRLLSEGQEKIGRDARCLRYVVTVPLCDGYHTYKIDTTNVLANTKARALSIIYNHAGKRCTPISRTALERLNPDWQTETGDDITHIVYDRQKPLHFRVYPIPDATKLPTSDTFNTTSNPISDAATIIAVPTNEGNFNITLETSPRKMLVWFLIYPPEITTIDDTLLLLPEEFDTALKHYVVGMALRDDKDSQNRDFGNDELKIFSKEYEIALDAVENQFIEQELSYYAPVTYQTVLE